jgi:hypothetical protein
VDIASLYECTAALATKEFCFGYEQDEIVRSIAIRITDELEKEIRLKGALSGLHRQP